MLKTFLQQLKQYNQRGLMRVAGGRAWAHEWLNIELTQLDNKDVIAFGLSQEEPEAKPIQQVLDKKLKQYKKYLGQESDIVVIDCYAGFNADALGALAGTVRLGGVCLLLTPDDQDWIDYADPELTRFCTEPYSIEQLSSFYIQRFITLLNASDKVLTVKQSGLSSDIKMEALLPNKELAFAGQTLGQSRAVKAMSNLLEYPNKTSVLLQADRGRGKSAALGLAIAQVIIEQSGLSKKPILKILLTAPVDESIQVVFKHLSLTLEKQNIRFKREENSLELEGASIQFIAPDQLMLELPNADLVLVDEAAAIPMQMLKPVLIHYPKVVFSTTVHGYEGTGRGFEYKLKPLIKKTFSQLDEIKLDEPIRWCVGDQLEQSINQLLALNAELPDISKSKLAEPHEFSFVIYKAAELSKQESKLTEVFSLLVNAHYRTSPNDLRQLLDSPNMQIVALELQGSTIAAALVAQEGELAESLVEPIWQGIRRPRGHLLPQSLIAHSGYKIMAQYRYQRIVRIAVHPGWQQQGLGSQLLSHIMNWAKNNNDDFVCTSFGYEASLYEFWLKNQLCAVRLGVKAEASTGEYSVFMLKALKAELLDTQHYLHHRFKDTYNVESLLGLRNENLVEQTEFNTPALESQDFQDLTAFAYYHRGLNTALLAMYKYVYTTSEKEQVPSLILDKVSGKYSDKALIIKYKLAGDKALVNTLRQAWQQVLEQHRY
jgi:tRNA(Met) cytidine acetyltransferase